MPSVLVIDRDERSAKLARVLLEDEGWTVMVVSTPAAGLRFLSLVRPELVVTELSATELFQQVTALKLAVLDTPIVAVTSLDGPGTELRAFSAGCSGFIRKPIDITTFASQLHTFLGDRSDNGSSGRR